MKTEGTTQQECEYCCRPATTQLRNMGGDVHQFRCGDHAFVSCVHDQCVVHHGWRAVIVRLGKDESGAQIIPMTVVCAGLDEWIASCPADESEQESETAVSPRKAIEAWVSEHDCETLETVPPGQLTRAEAEERARQEERAAAVAYLRACAIHERELAKAETVKGVAEMGGHFASALDDAADEIERGEHIVKGGG